MSVFSEEFLLPLAETDLLFLRVAAAKGLKVRRVLAGTYMVRSLLTDTDRRSKLTCSYAPLQTSLNMPGFSVSLFLLPRAGESKYTTSELLTLLDAPGDAPGWAWTSRAEPGVYTPPSGKSSAPEHAKNTGAAVAPASQAKFLPAIKQACQDVIAAEPEITRFDTYVSPSHQVFSATWTDCPRFSSAASPEMETVVSASRLEERASSMLSRTDECRTRTSLRPSLLLLSRLRLTWTVSVLRSPLLFLQIDLVLICSSSGTSGALYSIFFNGLASGLRQSAEKAGSSTATNEVWADALSLAKDTLYQYTRGSSLNPHLLF